MARKSNLTMKKSQGERFKQRLAHLIEDHLLEPQVDVSLLFNTFLLCLAYALKIDPLLH